MAVAQWSMHQNREFKVWESKQNTWVAKCKTFVEEQCIGSSSGSSQSCRWTVRALWKSSTHGMWEITKLVSEHNCSGRNRTSGNCNYTSPMIASHIRHNIRADPCYSIKSIQTDVKNDFGIEISYKKVWHARKRAIELIAKIHGCYETKKSRYCCRVAA